MAYIECPGCMNAPNEDHAHQYINVFSETTTCWWIDGHVFRTLWGAGHYIQEVLDCTAEEATWFARNLPTKYN